MRKNQNEWKYLINARDNIEAGMLKSMLKQAGIPTLEKHREAGAYLEIVTGFPTAGVDIYVPLNALSEAQAIIEYRESEIDDSIEEPYFNKRRNIARYLFLILFVIPALAATLWGTLDILRNVLSGL